MIVPYRCKNPPEQYPSATIGLIALNVLAYILTTHYLATIKDGIVDDFAVWPGHCNPVRLLVSIFLHEQPVHLIINMWFLWLFGTAVEGRLRIPKYLLLYFISGIVGGLIECWFELIIHSHAPAYGAAGAVMGLAGAYIYAFPFARIMVFRLIFISLSHIYFGPAEWLAWWVVLFYVGADAFNGVLATMMGMSDFFAYAAHVGGMLIGFLMAMALQTRRDSEMISQAQAVRSDLGNDLEYLSVSELESILEAPTEDMDLVLTYCDKAMLQPGEKGEKNALKMIETYKNQLLLRADVDTLTNLVLRIPKEIGGVSGPFYLRLGSKLELAQRFETAAYIYRRVYDIYQRTPDAGAALMRLARVWEQVFFNPELSQEAYTVYLEHFASGPLTEEAKNGLARVNAQLAGAKTGRLPSLQSDLNKEYSFMLHAEQPEAASAQSRPVAAPDLTDAQQNGGSRNETDPLS